MDDAECFEVAIEKIVAGGDGLGRWEGRVVFVPRAAPGERVWVRPVEARRDYVRAEIERLLDPSPDRRSAPCPFYGSCGGCALMHLTPKAQIEVKERILRESLRRLGGVEPVEAVASIEGPESGYRSRARFHVAFDAGRVVVGFRQRESHRIIDVKRCLLVSDDANRVLGAVRRWFADEPRRAHALTAFEILETDSPVQTSPEPGRVLLHFFVKKRGNLSRADLEAAAREWGLEGLVVTEEDPAGGRRPIRIGRSHAVHRIGGMEYRAGVDSFFQVNRFLVHRLVELVAEPQGAELDRVADLYCGVGLFTLPLARRAQNVLGVESSVEALADAKANARRAGLDNIEFVGARAHEYAARAGLGEFRLVVVDPPRRGLERPIIEELKKHPPDELRYVSCDSASLARDAGRLDRAGFRMEQATLLDLFPNTSHFETVAIFRRR